MPICDPLWRVGVTGTQFQRVSLAATPRVACCLTVRSSRSCRIPRIAGLWRVGTTSWSKSLRPTATSASQRQHDASRHHHRRRGPHRTRAPRPASLRRLVRGVPWRHGSAWSYRKKTSTNSGCIERRTPPATDRRQRNRDGSRASPIFSGMAQILAKTRRSVTASRTRCLPTG